MDMVIRMNQQSAREDKQQLKQLGKMVAIALCIVVCKIIADHIANFLTVEVWNTALSFMILVALITLLMVIYASFIQRRKQ